MKLETLPLFSVTRGQYFSKIGFQLLVDCEIDLVDCDSITEMAQTIQSVFCTVKFKFFGEICFSCIHTCFYECGCM